MITAISRPLLHGFSIAALALVGTLASFTATVGSAQAAAPKVYVVTLVNGLAAEKRQIIGGTMWRCEDTRCGALAKGERAMSVCGKVAKEFGQVASFQGPQGTLDEKDLARCNESAVNQ